jgi:hypothetical protein
MVVLEEKREREREREKERDPQLKRPLHRDLRISSNATNFPSFLAEIQNSFLIQPSQTEAAKISSECRASHVHDRRES